jgi:DNA-binding NarL/FixJ family response regulator
MLNILSRSMQSADTANPLELLKDIEHQHIACAAVRRAVAGLSKWEWFLVRCRLIKGYEVARIAGRIRCSKPTVRRHLNKAMDKLRADLANFCRIE